MKLAKVLSEVTMAPIVIIVNMLEESENTDSRRVRLRILGNLTERYLPPNLRINLTSRSLQDIYAALNQRWDACLAEIHA